MTLSAVNISTATAFKAVQVILATGVIISTLELLSIRHELRDDGWLSWLVQHRSRLRMFRRVGLSKVFQYPGVIFLLASRLMVALSLILCILFAHSSQLLLCLLTFSSILFTLRSPQGNDASDQMSMIALTAVTLAECVGTTFSVEACLIFIAAQSALAYATSGILKVRERGWRDGSFVTEMLKTSTFGNRSLLRLVEQSALLAMFLGCSVAMGDCLLGFAAFMPPALCLGALTFGLFFHLGIAAVLGLNTFVWSFVGTYPAVFWVSTSLYSRSQL